jgi:hypothetical protein
LFAQHLGDAHIFPEGGILWVPLRRIRERLCAGGDCPACGGEPRGLLLQIMVRRWPDFAIVHEPGREAARDCPRCGRPPRCTYVFEQLVEKGPDCKVHEYVRDGAGRMVPVPADAEQWPEARDLVPERTRV